MPNSFLGFPVPKAKVAEMIEGKAPPKQHKAQHEPTGDDPIVASGDISDGQAVGWDSGAGKFVGQDMAAGGIPFDDFLFITFFENLSGFNQTTASGGAITHQYSYVTISCDGTSGAEAKLLKEFAYPIPGLRWEAKQKLHSHIKFTAGATPHGELWFSRGEPSATSPGFGFVCEDGVLKAAACDGSTLNKTTIETLGTGSFNARRDLKAVRTSASEIEYYVDGTLEATLTNNLPDSGSLINARIYVKALDKANAVASDIELSMIKFHQAA